MEGDEEMYNQPSRGVPAEEVPTGTGGGQPQVNQFRQAAQGSYEDARQRAAERMAQEREAALKAKEDAVQLANDNQSALKDTANLAKDMRSEAEGLPPAALADVATGNMARVEDQYRANMAMFQKNREAVAGAQADAHRRMEELQGTGRQALETAVAATVDIARGEFEARCAKVLQEESKIQSMAVEIERREKQLSLLRSKGEPNWPCNCCCFSPLVHHDIVGDIPHERQSFMKKAYTNYFFTCFLLVANFGVALTMMFLKDNPDHGMGDKEKSELKSESIQHVVVSGVIMLGIVFAFVVWYWPTYKALGTGSSGQYLLAKVGVWAGMFFNLFAVLGPLGYGGCGLFYGLSFVQPLKGGDAFIPVICLVVLFAIQIIIFFWMFWRIRRFGKEDQASLAKAKVEMVGSEIRHAVGI